MSFINLANERTCVRGFTSQNVPDTAIKELLLAAQSAPSAGNLQPWHFYVIKDAKVISDMYPNIFSSNWICSAPLLIVVCLDSSISAKRYGNRGENLYCIQDTAAAIENILLSAKDLGLGACWIGAFDENECKSRLNIKNNHRPIALIPVGYPKGTQRKPPRKSLSEIVTYIGENISENEENTGANYPLFEHCDMSGAVFDDINLDSGKFNNINMHGVSISDANLTDATIQYCNLSKLSITDSLIDGLTINGVDICDILNNKSN